MKDIKSNNIINRLKMLAFTRVLSLCAFVLSAVFVSNSCDTKIEGSFIGEDAVSISGYIEEHQDTYSMFWELMVRTNLKNTLNSYNPHGNGYTLFLPSNHAFETFIENSTVYNSFEDLLNDPEYSNILIRYHIVNREINTNAFPFGALPDTTTTGDFLTVGFDITTDSTIFRINNQAPVIKPNIELVNGYIHVIDKVLEPIIYSSYDWILNNNEFSILSEALKLTGLKDTMGIFRYTSAGQLVKNQYTLLAEPDSVFHKKGIMNINDLIDKYQTNGLELNNFENDFYQFTAYHILEGSYFLDEFNGVNNFITYANFPLQINAGLEIKINPGKDTIDKIIEGQDTTIINYVRINMSQSNILTKNGAVHQLMDVMEVRKPGRTQKTYQFFEEPKINTLSKTPGEYELIDPELMEVLKWTGPESVTYFKSGSGLQANNNDYIEIVGNFTIQYTTPKILPGKYLFEINAESNNSENATIQIYFDGKRMGSSFNLTTGGNSYKTFAIGSVDIQNFETHEIKITTLLPGIFKWDFARFTPE